MTLRKKPFEYIMGKGKNAGYLHFTPFPTVFSTLTKDSNHHFNNIQYVVCKCFKGGYLDFSHLAELQKKKKHIYQ